MGDIIKFPGINDNFIKLPDEVLPDTYAYIDELDYNKGTYLCDNIFINYGFYPNFIGGFPCLKVITNKTTYPNISVVFISFPRNEYMNFVRIMKKIKEIMNEKIHNYEKICKEYLDIDLFMNLSMEKIMDALN